MNIYQQINIFYPGSFACPCRQAGRQAGRQADRQAGRQAGRLQVI